MTSTRRVIKHKAINSERDELSVITIFEKGVNKEQAKKANGYSKRHYVLINYNDKYDWK